MGVLIDPATNLDSLPHPFFLGKLYLPINENPHCSLLFGTVVKTSYDHLLFNCQLPYNQARYLLGARSGELASCYSLYLLFFSLDLGCADWKATSPFTFYEAPEQAS